MVNNCANPACNKSLHYLREGRIFLFFQKKTSRMNDKLPQCLEHFWLCGDCAKTWTLGMDRENCLQLIAAKHGGRKTHFSAASFCPLRPERAL